MSEYQKEPLRTDPGRWRLATNEEGVHHWYYLSEERADLERPQTQAEKYFLGLPLDAPVLASASSNTGAARNGLLFYEQLQLESGHWGCSYSGPSFLLPGIVFALYITNGKIRSEWAIEMTRWICHHQNADGGWGLHTQGPSTINATVMYYVTLRILGMEKTNQVAIEARKKLLELGGALLAPQWARYWLALLNLYNWEGIQPVPSEMWILPEWIPFHPWRWWVQCRAVYLPVSYLYSNKFQMEKNDLIMQLREEIFCEPYSSISFPGVMNQAGPHERRRPLSGFLTVANSVLGLWESYLRPKTIHRKANDAVRGLIQREDENTAFNDIAPVNKAFHMVAVYFSDGPNSEALKSHHEKVSPYLWKSAQGMNCGGTNGAQLWDTAFSVISIAEGQLGREPQFRATLEKAHKFLEVSQFQDDLDDPFRQRRKGGWPFSTKDNSYIVSDCAAEGLKATLLLQEELNFQKLISDERVCDCVDTLLEMQNIDGGFGSYEAARTGTFVEMLNPAELFDRCMVEYSYPECTSAVMTSLALFNRHFPAYATDKISEASKAAQGYLEKEQRLDGSWYGSWAICFTYGTMFGLEGLAAVGQDYSNSVTVRRACEFLISKQKEDGGWGEHWESCQQGQYIEHERSQVVNTAWAVLGLMTARYPEAMVVSRGIDLILSRQQANGEWLQEGIEGIFNGTCTIEYPNYKFIFPIRALGRFDHDYLSEVREKRK